MAAANYAALETAVLQQLANSPGFAAATDAGRPIHTTDDIEQAPTMEQCPCVQVAVTGAARTLTRMAPAAGRPYNERITLTVRCCAFSAESIADARRQRDELTTTVIDALERDMSLGGRVAWLEIPGSVMEQAGNFSAARLTLILSLTS